MANEIDDIVQNIVFTDNGGAAEIFNRIEEAGARAFEGLTGAAEKAGEAIDNAFGGNEKFEQLSKSIGNLAGSFGTIIEAVAGVAAAIGIVTVGLFAFVKENEESVSSLSDLADQMGTTTETMSGLRAAFAAGGVSSDTMATAFRRLSIITQTSWNEIKKASRDAADAQKKDVADLVNSQLALGDAQQKQENLSRDQGFKRQQDLQGVAGARQKLDELTIQSQKAAGIDTSALEQQLEIQRQQLEFEQATLALKQAKAKAADDEANKERETLKAANDKFIQETTLSQLQKKIDDDQKNDINNIIKSVASLADGNKNALDKINPSVENLMKGIVGSVPQAQEALGALRGDITDLSSPAPKVMDVFDQFSRVMSQLTDSSQKTALAQQFLGRSVTQSEINVLSSSEKLHEFRKRIDDLGIGINDADKAISEKFRETLFGFENDLTLVGNKISSVFGPAFTTVIEALDSALIANKQTLLDWATTIASHAVPVVESFIRVLSGTPDAAKDQWLVDYVNKIKAFASGVGQAAVAVATGIGLINSGFQLLADGLNSVFGTNLNTFDVLVGAFVAKIAARFLTMVQAAIAAASGIEIAFFPLTALLAVIGGAVYVVVTAFQTLSAFFNTSDNSNWTKIFDNMLTKLQSIVAFMTGDFKKASELWAQAAKEQADAWKEIDKANEESTKNQKDRADDLAKTQKEATDKTLSDYKKQLADITAASHASADSQVEDHKKVAASQHELSDNNKRTEKDLQTIKDNGLIAGQGQSIGGSKTSGGGGAFVDEHGVIHIPPGASQSSINDAVGQTQGASGPGGVANLPFGANPKQQEDILKAAEEFRQGIDKLQKNVPLPQSRPSGADALTDSERLSDAFKHLPPDTFTNKSGLTDADIAKLKQHQDTPSTDTNKPDEQKAAVPNNTLQEIQNIINSFGAKLDELKPQQPTPQNNNTDQNKSDKSDVNSALSDLGTKAQTTSEAFDGISAGVDAVKVSFDDVGSGVDTLKSSFDTLSSAVDSLSAKFAGMQTPSTPSTVGGGGGDTIQVADGGWIRGAGTETSDSIPAWLSHNEFVQPARATRFYGVEFMEAVRNLRLPKFATGGLVNLMAPMMPRFADGGRVNVSGSSLPNLGTVDLTTDHGAVSVIVNRNSLHQLKKAAVLRNMGSNPKPSWVR